MVKKLAFAVALAASVAWAEEAEEAQTDEVKAEAGQPAKVAPKISFLTLPLCRLVEGEAFVRPAGSQEWAAAEEGRFYPLGTAFRTTGRGRLTIAFAADSTASIAGEAEFATRPQALNVSSRTVVLIRGALELKLADNLPEGAFFVTFPSFVVKNPAGESRYVYEDMGDGDKVTVSCKTGSLGVEGRHFAIPVMRSANTVAIRSSRDMLSTFLYGISGDYIVKLDKNLRMKDEIDNEGKVTQTQVREYAEYHLSPATKVVINRSVPAIGERMSAFIMAFDASGERVGEGISVCEGRAEINSGELVDKEKLDSGELAKRAAEATETTAASETETAAADEAKPEDEKKTSDNNEE